jgi:Putative HNHc nuclease
MMQRRPRRRDEFHLKWIRERPCILCGATPVDAAHIKMADGRIGKPIASMNEKADDRFTLPLCRAHHLEQHESPERGFWEGYHCDPVLLALALYSITGDDEAGDHLIRTTAYALQELRA